MIAMTREEADAYSRDGYILRKGLLSLEEVERFRDTARAQLERENREGAVAINIWTGYAALVINKTGERKVIVGPTTYLLEYDEILEIMKLSTGTPKQDNTLLRTVYLRVLHNKVSDVIDAETRDLCPVKMHLSYRVNFEGDPEKWFDVENYVKFLTDHTRSMLRNAIKRHGIEEFYSKAIQIIRDTIIGSSSDGGKRPGLVFEENGMRIYDVEVLDVVIGDETISDLLVQSQHSAVQQTLELAADQRNLEAHKQKETIRRSIAEADAETQQLLLDLQITEAAKRLTLKMAQIQAEAEAEQRKLDAQLAQQQALETVNAAELARQDAKYALDLSVTERRMRQKIEELQADVEAVVKKANAVSPQLIAALQAFSDKALAERVAESMSPMAILGGKSVADVFAQLVKGTILERALAPAAPQLPETPAKKK